MFYFLGVSGGRGRGGHKFVNFLVTNTKNEPYFYTIYYVCWVWAPLPETGPPWMLGIRKQRRHEKLQVYKRASIVAQVAIATKEPLGKAVQQSSPC